MVVLICDHDVSFPRHGNPGRPVKLAWPHSFRSKLVHELTVGVKDLNSVVATVTNNDVTLLVAADAPRATELCVARTFASERLRNNSKPPVLSSAIDDQLERTPRNVSSSDGNVE